MTRRGLGEGVVLPSMEEHDAVIDQPAEPALEVAIEALEVVGPHLVNDEKDHQRGRTSVRP